MKLKPENLDSFYEKIKPYYFKSKQFYLERDKKVQKYYHYYPTNL